MQKPGGCSDTVPSQLASELRAVLGKLIRRLSGKSVVGDLPWPQKSALSHLEREGSATVSTLARIEGVRPQSMGATVAALEAAGLVQGAADPDDGRQTLMSLTPACVDMLRAGRAARQDWLLRAIHAHLTPHEQQELAHALRLLARLVD